jgi:ATP-dependent exoDNAse (exonuclease V) alpha subunit
MIPHIVKGKGISGALAYVMGEGSDRETKRRKTLAEGQESRAQIIGGQNFGFEIDSKESLELARRGMEWNGLPQNQASRGIKCEKDCLHASLSWEKGQNPTAEEMAEAAQGYLKALGMEKAQAVFVAHNDTAQKHLHIVASRIDPTTGKTFSQADDFAKGLAWSMEFEKAQGVEQLSAGRQKLHKMADAIAARDVAALTGQLTETNPTFTAKELDKVLAYGGLSKEDRAGFKAEILADKNVIGLRETADSEVSRYTTRDVLAAEMALLRNAKGLAEDYSHGLSDGRIAATAAEFTLKPEQADALQHLTGGEGFAMLWGEAGTGKSHTLNAARAAYEAEGSKVIGLAWTNDVAQQMRGDGFGTANTIASELKGLENGRSAWNKNTVLIVDEAAMVATEHLAQVAAAARAAGAKLILAGDDAQLSSIERGGMFETLRQTHGAAILQDVQRVSTAEQKAAFNQMHRGEFKGALQTFDKAGGIHWTDKPSDALQEMAARYTADVANDPDKRRFMFAFTNAEVKTLNDHARALHKERGDLGSDHSLPTAAGAQEFATGDRIQFAGNGYGQKQIRAGFTNGRVGTITEIDTSGDRGGDAPRVTVSLDTKKGAEPQSVSFTVGEDAKAGEFNKFKLGYAGTIYRGQGRTLDQSYVCHSAQWRSSAAYVALTRHREDVQIFVSRETVRGMEKEADRASFDQAAASITLDPAQQAAARHARDLDLMAEGLARTDNKRAATAYQIDEATALRLGFGEAANITDRQHLIYDPEFGSRIVTNARAEAHGAARDTAGAEVAESPAHASTEAQEPAERLSTGEAMGNAVEGAAQLAEGVASFTEKALVSLTEGLAGLFGGGSTPAPRKAPEPEPKRKLTMKEFLAEEQAQRTAKLAAIKQQIESGQSVTQEDLNSLPAEQQRNRDRGGGQSL